MHSKIITESLHVADNVKKKQREERDDNSAFTVLML